MSEQQQKKGWLTLLREAITGLEAEYTKLPKAQRKILRQKGFGRGHMNSLVRVRDEAIVPVITGTPVPERDKKRPPEDPNQTTIYDFINAGAVS